MSLPRHDTRGTEPVDIAAVPLSEIALVAAVLVPLLGRLADRFLEEQGGSILVQPPAQPGPVPDQRLMRDLDLIPTIISRNLGDCRFPLARIIHLFRRDGAPSTEDGSALREIRRAC